MLFHIIVPFQLLPSASENKIKVLRKRKHWRKRRLVNTHSSNVKLIRGFEATDNNEYKYFLRIDKKNYKKLLVMIAPLFQKEGTAMRDGEISPIAVNNFMFLETVALSYEELKILKKIAPQTIA